MPQRLCSMARRRLDAELVDRGLVASRSQAESYIKLGYVYVNGAKTSKAGTPVLPDDNLEVRIEQQYVSRAALKLDSVAKNLGLDFDSKVVLDVGSSTGGFTEYALRHGAIKVIAVDVGSNQLHPSLRSDPRVEIHESTDIRDFREIKPAPNIVLIDVSFISLREVLPYVLKLTDRRSQVVAMFKPQFEAGSRDLHKGVIKNDKMRRQIIRDFEVWVKDWFRMEAKADSQVAGAKGNLERFYLLRPLQKRF